MTTTTLYEIARLHRDRAWDHLNHSFGDWEPDGDEPKGDVELWWYLHGKAEAYAAIMSELETSGSLTVR